MVDPMVRCRIRKIHYLTRTVWSCVVFRRGYATECQHFPTWDAANSYAQQQVTRA